MSKRCLWFVWVACAMVAGGRPDVTAGGGPGTEAKVVRQYALTSANDFPQRDPQDWRLLGSNDEGKTWTTLDARKGEVFSERHQRRVFKVARPQAFSLYRLQIDRVRNPAAADGVQLAEIEPLGETEEDLEPAPLWEDRLTAQGENPPLETRFQAFDGEVETKWLDRAVQDPARRGSWIEWQYTSARSQVITNRERLAGLRNRASRGYPVRIEGVVAGRLPGTNGWCLWDGTGSLEIAGAAEGERLFAGQRVVVEGTSRWANGRVEVAQLRLERRGGVAPAEPRRMALEQPLEPEQELQWVEVEGRLQFCSWADYRLMFELEDNGRSLSVHVLHADAALRLPPAGTRVSVRGICGSLLDAKGERVAGTLWVPSLEGVRGVRPVDAWSDAAVDRGPTPGAAGSAPLLTRIEQIRRLNPEELVRWPKVKVRGVVTELFGAFIQEGTAGVEVWYGSQGSKVIPRFGSCVEIEGRGDWATGHGPIIRADRVVVLGPGKLPRPEPCSWSQLASGKMVDQWIEIEGVVRSTDGSHLLLNTEGGQLMATIRSAPAPLVKRLVDATVRVRGVSVAASDSRGRMQGIQLLVPSLECVEVGRVPADPFSLPARPIGSLMQVRGPKEFIHRVKVEGVLTFQEGRRFFLQDASGGAMAIAQEDVILNTPAGGWSWMFGQSADGDRKSKEGLPWQAGDHLQVIGFPEMRGYSPVLTEVLVRKLAATNAVTPVKATVEEIVGGGLDATLVSLEGTLLRQQPLGAQFVLELESGESVFQAFLPRQGRSPPSLAAGSKVRVTGVCEVEPMPYTELGKRAASFKVLVGSAGDVLILKRPPWWTLKHLLALMGTLVVVLALAGGWIGILRRQVGERTKQLEQEIAEHEKTEARLGEETRRVQAEIEERKRMEAEVERGHKQLLKASRLAGMAEVATSVLHNVGNVLNSANVLAALIMDHVQRSKVPSVGRLAALLGEHRANLGRFVSEDSRGQHLPAYLERLAGHLGEEQSRLLEKMKSLTESLQHIKETVAMQQNYARALGVLETVSLAEIVEDALRMHAEALARHQIRVVREYEEAPPATADRHKLLQILFNLFENAKYACEESGRVEKQVTVRLQADGAERIRVEVSDNGVGIPAENLGRIFAQQFSTRKGGHGIGLHGSALAAQEMGASLSAHSDGPGQGATFTLDIPIKARRQA